ncbi:hypothetical protein Focb16_v003614 [Fusarium oxysporum f. sp. cubense]|uniref:Uncharacterized protein n=1 Tax=Fusarium oxysporum f. sp. cubense TaxID=61366 RepID=A0A559KKC3_FUSOC|nr:hypothetical protein Focb16_v003614 [Fusarium oxysporum f. sp. cubense]
MCVKNCGSLDGSPPPLYHGGSADEDSVCSEDSGISTWHGRTPDVKPEMNDLHRLIWDQDRHFDKYGQFGALPYDHTVNARLSFQHVPTSYSPPAYDHTCPSQLDPESDVSESEPDQSPKDDPQVKTEAKNYIDPVDVILNEIRRLHMADVQLKTELITRLESQCAMYSQSMSVVQGQLSQANTLIEFWGEQTDTNTKQLEIVDSRCLDRHINAQGSIKELSDLMMTDIKERRSFRHSLEDKGLIQIT